MDRTTTAFLVAPIVGAAATGFVLTLLGGLDVFGPGFLVTLVLAYAGMLIFGWPAYRILVKRRWTALWIAPALGFVVGIVMSLPLLSILYKRAALEDALLTLPGGCVGALVGVVFWLIARPDRTNGA